MKTTRTEKTWSDFTPKYRRELVAQVADVILNKVSTMDEADAFLKQVVQRIQTKTGQTLPSTVAQPALTETQCAEVIAACGKLRADRCPHNSQLHIPKITANDLDQAVVSTSLSHSELLRLGYDIGRAQYSNAKLQDTPSSSRVGRKTKINNEELIKFVGTVVVPYAKDSSHVVCVRSHGEKLLVCAKLLSKTVFGIWKNEPIVRERMGFSTFRKIVKVHFPHLRRPRRKTDVCSHCRLLNQKIAPRAFKEYNKRRKRIAEHAPNYFDELDADANFAGFLRDNRYADAVLQARQYINVRNANARNDPQRAPMSLRVRCDLFSAEARAVHKLKGHCELLDAYLWHKLSADRQRQFADNLLEHLAGNEACLHFDFKENVRYPMSKEETGDEWHAQNKLSLTVFGCTVHTPGRKDMHFLLVTEVLDHDSQIARLMITKILDTIKGNPAYEWSKVKMLNLVCDCGPHFRSREGYAFFLHDLPRKFGVDDACPSWSLSAFFSPLPLAIIDYNSLFLNVLVSVPCR